MAEGFRPENSPPYTIDNPKIYLTGDIMYDNTLFYASLAEKKKKSLLEQLFLKINNYVLVTIHRDTNTDNTERLQNILTILRELAEDRKIMLVMPLHPRTIVTLKIKLPEFFKALSGSHYIKIIPPVSFLEMIMLEKNCRMIITDSGGVQKESHFFKKPCIILRKETEWIELVNNGTSKLVDADPLAIRKEFENYMDNSTGLEYPGFYGDGKTAEFILKEILTMVKKD
jgi:UDP-GlcNAc3NAcA epimerase